MPKAIPPEATMPAGAFYGQEGASWNQEATQARQVHLWGQEDTFYGQEGASWNQARTARKVLSCEQEEAPRTPLRSRVPPTKIT